MALLTEFVGGTPKVPRFDPVDAQGEQQRAIQGNIDALPDSTRYGAGANDYFAKEYQKMFDAASGGYYGRIQKAVMGNAYDWITGKVDLTDTLSNTAAANLARGVGGSAFGNIAGLRRSSDYVNQMKLAGLDTFGKWMAGAATPVFDVTKDRIDPTTQLQHAVNERNAKFQHDYIENQWEWYGSFGQQLVRFEDTVIQLAGDVAGAAGAMCWVAREVFTPENPQWLLFRHWLLTCAPKWFYNLYLKHGERFAKWISDKPDLKAIIRAWMESRISTLEVSHELV